jgi:SAM-dependent methyltransferase
VRCPRCFKDIEESIKQCQCGFLFDEVSREQLQDWFAEVKQILENAYIVAATPWQQSGKRGTFEDWMRLRLPNLAPVNRPGTYLDVGCANGYLLECLLAWTQLKGVKIEPYGLDLSLKLVTLAKKRLSTYTNNIYRGNIWDWQPLRRFDYVRTELDYVPYNYRKLLIERLLREFLEEDGKLLLSHYRSSRDNLAIGWIDDDLKAWGFKAIEIHSGYDANGLELCRVAVLRSLLSHH